VAAKAVKSAQHTALAHSLTDTSHSLLALSIIVQTSAVNTVKGSVSLLIDPMAIGRKCWTVKRTVLTVLIL
jgi:hypothetical protein